MHTGTFRVDGRVGGGDGRQRHGGQRRYGPAHTNGHRVLTPPLLLPPPHKWRQHLVRKCKRFTLAARCNAKRQLLLPPPPPIPSSLANGRFSLEHCIAKDSALVPSGLLVGVAIVIKHSQFLHLNRGRRTSRLRF